MKATPTGPTLTNNPWFAFVRPNAQAKLRLFCFPYAGGGALAYRTWQNSLPAAVEVRPVCYPGRETRIRETPFSHVTPLAEALSQAILPLLDKPFAFLGHSVGALVVFELARTLRRQHGKEPAHLLVSGHYAPQLFDPDPPICGLPDPEFVEQIRRYNGMPQQVLESAELMQLLIPILRADLLVNETYVYTDEPPLSCPISAFAGSQDRKMSRESLEAWRVHTTNTFSSFMFEGDHFFLFADQSLFLQRLVRELDSVLTRLT